MESRPQIGEVADPHIASPRVAALLAAHMGMAARMLAHMAARMPAHRLICPLVWRAVCRLVWRLICRLIWRRKWRRIWLPVWLPIWGFPGARTTLQLRDRDWRRLQPTMDPYSRVACHPQTRPARAFCVQILPRRHAATVLACRRNRDQTGAVSSFGTARERRGSMLSGSDADVRRRPGTLAFSKERDRRARDELCTSKE